MRSYGEKATGVTLVILIGALLFCSCFSRGARECSVAEDCESLRCENRQCVALNSDLDANIALDGGGIDGGGIDAGGTNADSGESDATSSGADAAPSDSGDTGVMFPDAGAVDAVVVDQWGFGEDCRIACPSGSSPMVGGFSFFEDFSQDPFSRGWGVYAMITLHTSAISGGQPSTWIETKRSIQGTALRFGNQRRLPHDPDGSFLLLRFQLGTPGTQQTRNFGEFWIGRDPYVKFLFNGTSGLEISQPFQEIPASLSEWHCVQASFTPMTSFDSVVVVRLDGGTATRLAVVVATPWANQDFQLNLEDAQTTATLQTLGWGPIEIIQCK